MQLTIIKHIGKRQYPFTVEGKNLFEIVQESQKLSFQDVDKCGLCQSDNLFLASHVAQNKYDYVHITCASCRAQLVFGQKKEDRDTFFLRKNEDKSYQWQAFNKDDWNQDQKNDAQPPVANQPPVTNGGSTNSESPTYANYTALIGQANKIKTVDDMVSCELDIQTVFESGRITDEERKKAILLLGKIAKARNIGG